ncbi:MAG: DMT family transporter [Deltaproteobacteria bacterium]|nr:DMT family transporter [Candidatus Zymogenaceae bacterium]
MTPKKGYIADLSLVLICLFWGTSFILVKMAIMEVDLYYFVFLRFILAVFIVGGLFYRRLPHYNLKILRDGVIMGAALFGAFALQTIGLKYTSASNAGFITGLHVVLVPLMLALIFKRKPALNATMGAVVCAIGLFFLTVGDTFTINRGDVWVVLCAVFVGLHVIFTGWFAVRHDVYLLALTQLVTVMVLSLASSFILGEGPVSPFALSPFVILVVVVMGIFATAFNFTVQTWAQQYTTPTRAAVIFTMEPVFAAIFAYWWGSEVLGSRGYLGAALILAGIILTEIKITEWREGKNGSHTDDRADTEGSSL